MDPNWTRVASAGFAGSTVTVSSQGAMCAVWGRPDLGQTVSPQIHVHLEPGNVPHSEVGPLQMELVRRSLAGAGRAPVPWSAWALAHHSQVVRKSRSACRVRALGTGRRQRHSPLPLPPGREEAEKTAKHRASFTERKRTFRSVCGATIATAVSRGRTELEESRTPISDYTIRPW